MRVLLAVAAVALIVALGLAARGVPETAGERVDRITAQLRCPVCQGLSVKDSPSETARAMRDVVVQRVSEGRTDPEIRNEFRASYGDWVFLDPPLAGVGAFIWLAPVALLLGGLLFAWRLARGQPEPSPEADPAAVAALHERARREEAVDA